MNPPVKKIQDEEEEEPAKRIEKNRIGLIISIFFVKITKYIFF